MDNVTNNRNFLNLTRVGLANKPVNRYTDAVKNGNWREDRIQRQFQGDLLANTMPPTFDWDITGKVGSCEDHIRKKEYQDYIVEKMECKKEEVPHTESDCGDSWIKPKFGMEGEMPTLRHRGPHYNELDDARWNNTFSKRDEDESNGMKTSWERQNHHMYEGYEPAYKMPKVCQHKRDFFPVNINWGLGVAYRKQFALREFQRKHHYVTTYRVAYGPEQQYHENCFVYHDPPCLPKQKPLVMYRRPEMGKCAEMNFTPLQQLHPPRSQELRY